MRKSKIKWALKKSMQAYYKSGLTNTANKMQRELLNRITRETKANNR